MVNDVFWRCVLSKHNLKTVKTLCKKGTALSRIYLIQRRNRVQIDHLVLVGHDLRYAERATKFQKKDRKDGYVQLTFAPKSI